MNPMNRILIRREESWLCKKELKISPHVTRTMRSLHQGSPRLSRYAKSRTAGQTRNPKAREKGSCANVVSF
jgi:hypothetical protein